METKPAAEERAPGWIVTFADISTARVRRADTDAFASASTNGYIEVQPLLAQTDSVV